mgnify:CR=1 FL=1
MSLISFSKSSICLSVFFLASHLTKWIEKGSIAWCHIEEVKAPYEVEKVVKKIIKAEKKNDTSYYPICNTSVGSYLKINPRLKLL